MRQEVVAELTSKEDVLVSQWGLIKRGTTVTIYLVISFQQRILKIFQSLSKWFY
jgi:hypothetical protein